MPRDLADVLHYFLPELDDASPPSATPEDERQPPRNRRLGGTDNARPPLPILGIPIGDRDVMRAAFAWNLAVETSRLGGTSLLLAPESEVDSPLWPPPGIGPLGCELIFSPAEDLASLYATAGELAQQRGRKNHRGGIIFVRIPPAWLRESTAPLASNLPPALASPLTSPPQSVSPSEVPAELLQWLLLLTPAKAQDLGDVLETAQIISTLHPTAEIGVTVFGVQTIAEARRAYDSLAHSAHAQFQLDLRSYGLLVDDLNVYRSIAAQRPIGLDYPQAPAARAIADVAELLYEDARSRVLG